MGDRLPHGAADQVAPGRLEGSVAVSDAGGPPDDTHEDPLHERFRELRRTCDTEIREALIKVHLPLVRALSRRFANRGEPLEDLISVGTLALIHAIDRFDPEQGTRFSTFATPTVIG
ncbi:MAG: hypothetical protein HYU66_04500, partial [Armatimonadetes bacterium]|nr:hypothetical protein [Armatimonadota bacterium]